MGRFSLAVRVVTLEVPEDPEDVDTSVIRKTPGKGYCVKSEKNPGWSGGCYPTRGEAEKRLNQIEYFKREGSVDAVVASCCAILSSDVPDASLLESFCGLLSAYNAAGGPWDLDSRPERG